MGIIDGLKQSILRCDLLSCSPTLRVRGQAAYQSVLGGFLSFLIMGCFIAIFSSSFIQVLNKVNIDSTMSSSDKTDSDNQINDLMFAVGIQGVRLGGTNRYFDIFMEQISITATAGGGPTVTRNQIILNKCNSSDWQNIGDNFDVQFRVFQMQKMLCPVSGSQVVMKGYQGSTDYSYLVLKIKTCSNNSYQAFPCYSHPAISSYMSSYLTTNDYFKVKFMVADTRISPAQQDPISQILQKKIFMSFTDELGTTGFISFSHYSVTTDNSILPYQSSTQLTGSFIHNYATNTIGLSSDRFVHLQFCKSTQQLTVSRAVVKVDEMLSYAGGLFGLLWVGVAFFLASYNEYKYQLYAAQSAFTFDQSGRKIKEKDFGFFSYISYSIYDWLNVFGIAPKCWTKMRQIDEVRQQINSQLDVTYLFRKIRSLQKITSSLLNENKRICSMLTRQMTLQQTQQQRKILQFYDKLVPSPCQDHFRRKSNQNKIENSDQFSGQNFITGVQKFTTQQNQSELEQMSCISQLDQNQDEDFQGLMNIIKDAYSTIEVQNDQISKRIKQRIPVEIKKAIYKKRMTRKLQVQTINNKKFESCQNSFMSAKLK